MYGSPVKGHIVQLIQSVLLENKHLISVSKYVSESSHAIVVRPTFRYFHFCEWWQASTLTLEATRRIISPVEQQAIT